MVAVSVAVQLAEACIEPLPFFQGFSTYWAIRMAEGRAFAGLKKTCLVKRGKGKIDAELQGEFLAVVQGQPMARTKSSR